MAAAGSTGASTRTAVECLWHRSVALSRHLAACHHERLPVRRGPAARPWVTRAMLIALSHIHASPPQARAGARSLVATLPKLQEYAPDHQKFCKLCTPRTRIPHAPCIDSAHEVRCRSSPPLRNVIPYCSRPLYACIQIAECPVSNPNLKP